MWPQWYMVIMHKGHENVHVWQSHPQAPQAFVWSQTVDFSVCQQLLTQSSEMLHDVCKKIIIVGGNTSGGSKLSMEDGCARRMLFLSLETREMNCWMVSSDRFGCCQLKSMTSASVRDSEDILAILWDITSLLPQQVAHYLFVIVWHFSASIWKLRLSSFWRLCQTCCGRWCQRLLFQPNILKVKRTSETPILWTLWVWIWILLFYIPALSLRKFTGSHHIVPMITWNVDIFFTSKE